MIHRGGVRRISGWAYWKFRRNAKQKSSVQLPV
jgi:hypothetical protein